MSNEQLYDSSRAQYGEGTFLSSEREKFPKRQRPTLGRKRGKVPQSINGIHRRRRRKLAW
ncbi:MAG: hypothetical protein WD851_21495 [Pirellulales bacterium]